MANSSDVNTDKNKPSYRSIASMTLAPSLKLTSDLWGSALDIRQKGTEYLTQFNKEPNSKYEARKDRSVFQNEFRESIERMAGMVFRSDPKPDDLPQPIDAMMTDVNLCGDSFWKFAIDAFEKYLRDGNGGILVDMPPLSESAQAKLAAGGQLTLADRSNDRPFWVFYEASQIVNARYRKDGSRQVLEQITLEERTLEADGAFGEREVVRYRVLRPGSWAVYEQKTEDDLVIVAEGDTAVPEILFFTFTDLDEKPPLLTLALLNILNYNQKSDYDDVCHVVCTPLRVQKYAAKEDADVASKVQTASPGVGLKIWGDQSDVFYAEIEGKGLERARERYLDVQKDMAAIGVGMFGPVDGAAAKTASEVMDNAGQRQSRLARFARNFENTVEKAFYATAQFFQSIGMPGIDLDETEADARIKLKIDYDRLTFSFAQLNFFSDLVDSQKLSLQTFLQYLGQHADMPDDFNGELEMERIAAVNTPIASEVEPEPAN